jgi:hypothetical protein
MGNNINVILGSKGKCCLCSNTPHCGDCDEEPPPPPPPPNCDCNVCGLFNIPAACEDKAKEFYGACGKCTNVGPCDVVCGSGVGTQGCYAPEPVNCLDLGCFDCEPSPEPPEDPCIKIVDDECSCADIELTCCSYANKTCTDFNFNYFSDTHSAEAGCAGTDCYKKVAVECETLTCYECKTCADFGLSDTKLTCDPGFVLRKETPCGSRLTCYDCVDIDCNCNNAGLANSCSELTLEGECEVCEGDTGYLPTPECKNVYCYYTRSKNCSELSDGTCEDCDSPTKDDDCYFQLPTLRCLCVHNFEQKVVCCEEEPLYCAQIGYLKEEVWGDSPTPPEPCECDESWEPIASGCEETTGCYSCQKMDCWKVTGVSTAAIGSPCCSTTANLTHSKDCSKGPAETVAINNVSGTFTVTCNPPGGCEKVWPDPDCGEGGPCCCAGYCTGKATDTVWPIGPAVTVVATGCTTARATFEFEDCGLPPADFQIYIDLEMCFC